MTVQVREAFWHLPLTDLTDAEWELLCDRCGRCCLHKLQDEADDQVYFTNVMCRLFDLKRGGCSRYTERRQLVPDCLSVREEGEAAFAYLPTTCAYRLRHEGRRLPVWHPLLTGTQESVHQAGISLCHRAVSELDVNEADMEDHIVDWIKA